MFVRRRRPSGGSGDSGVSEEVARAGRCVGRSPSLPNGMLAVMLLFPRPWPSSGVEIARSKACQLGTSRSGAS